MNRKKFTAPEITYVKLDLTIVATETSENSGLFGDIDFLTLDEESGLMVPGLPE